MWTCKLQLKSCKNINNLEEKDGVGVPTPFVIQKIIFPRNKQATRTKMHIEKSKERLILRSVISYCNGHIITDIHMSEIDSIFGDYMETRDKK